MPINAKNFRRFDKQVNELLEKMTLREKIGQLNQSSKAKTPEQQKKYEDMCRNGEMGSMIIAATSTAGNTDEYNVLTEYYNEFQKIAVNESRLGIPLIFGRDVIHGHRTVFPIPLASACSFNPELLEKCYHAIAQEAQASGKKVVGVIFGGRPLALQLIEPYLDAILYAWHCGTETAHAACDIIFGDVNPSGKASVTFVKTTGHIPLYYNQLVPAKKINTYYGVENVIRNTPASSGYLDHPAIPMYSFGFGLSYTTFEISKPTVSKAMLSADALKSGECFAVSVTVKNCGTRKGKETVQLYIHDLIASYVRPQKELKRFQKIELEAGEEREVTFLLGHDELGFFDERGKYLLEDGEFEVFVGDDCMTTNKTVITLQG